MRGGRNYRGGRGGKPQQWRLKTPKQDEETTPPPPKEEEETPAITTTITTTRTGGDERPIPPQSTPPETRTPRKEPRGDDYKPGTRRGQGGQAPRPVPAYRVKAEPIWPKIGEAETAPGHIVAVQSEWDRDTLVRLWQGLATENPRRDSLIELVKHQVIRQELRELVGGDITTMANIQVDDSPVEITTPRNVYKVGQPDDEIVEGPENSERLVEIWNRSLKDSEVDTIKDIKKWADTVDPQELAGKKITMQIVGNCGPCDACKVRLERMADAILDRWHERGVPREKLPRLQLWSYYSNDPNMTFSRGRFDVRDGWLEDDFVPAMTFTSKKDREAGVRVHQMSGAGPTVQMGPEKTETFDDLVETNV